MSREEWDEVINVNPNGVFNVTKAVIEIMMVEHMANTNNLRVFLGPQHITGMLWEYRQGLRSIGIDAKVVIFNEHRFNYPADIKFTGCKYIRFLKRCIQLPILIHNFDIFHFIFGQSLLSYPYNLDVPILKLFRKKIVMHFLGSDIRPIDLRKNHYDENRINKKKKLVEFWEKNADAIISYPEQSQLLTKKYYVIPLGYDLEYWKPFTSNKFKKDKDKVLIIHAPSNRKIKGTKYVLKAVESLKKDGYKIDFKLLEGVSNSEVREWLNISDIVIDQFVGGYASFATESMALAKPTLGYISKKWKSDLDYLRNTDIPIVNTTPNTICDNLKLLIESPELRKELGEKSRKYVEEVHDSKKIAKRLLELYTSL